MTRKEAIEAIKCNWPDSRYTILREALDMAISALRSKQELKVVEIDQVKPLTLDELRKMYDGEDGHVWVRFGNSRRCWPAILDTYDGELVAVWSAAVDFCHEKDYGKTWLAYRRKPEEGTV